MNKRRLLALANFLEKKVPTKHFDMDVWVDPGFAGDPSSEYINKAKCMPTKSISCGTSACALGWATAVRCLRKAGLHIEDQYNMPEPVIQKGRRKLYGVQAASELFDISDTTSRRLFMPSEYSIGNPTPKYVAKRIRSIVNAKNSNLDTKDAR